jgi:hypothetical protein
MILPETFFVKEIHAKVNNIGSKLPAQRAIAKALGSHSEKNLPAITLWFLSGCVPVFTGRKSQNGPLQKNLSVS